MPLGRPLNNHLSNSQPYLGIVRSPCPQEPLFHQHQTPEQLGSLHGWGQFRLTVALLHHFLAAKTTWETLPSSIRAGEGGRHAMTAADHQTVVVKPAAPSLIKRAHDLRPRIFSQGQSARLYVAPRAPTDFFQTRRVKLLQALAYCVCLHLPGVLADGFCV